MKSNRCLYCYNALNESDVMFHPACSKKIFGKAEPPELLYSERELLELGLQVVRSQSAVTGAQPKLSLDLLKGEGAGAPLRLTIVGVHGKYILKPQTDAFPFLPEIEDLTMHLAEIAGIATVPHSLIQMKSGRLAYITKRIDRTGKEKIHMEDMCQLTERLTEHKYQGSQEQIGKAIMEFSVNPGLDLVNFYEQVLFCFLTGNADMHLKNFSLINRTETGTVLTPAYDMVSTALVMPDDKEELGLTLNGKKKKIKLSDFMKAMTNSGIPEKAQINIVDKMETSLPAIIDFVKKSFLPSVMQEKYKAIIVARARQLHLQVN
ncbi:MAG: HipA domain-containing protein [Bacteroidota bacterium]